MSDGWIVIPNWDKFQHYSDRDPVWIKLYTELMSREEWCRLTDAQCGVLVKVWLEYARSRGVLSVGRMAGYLHRANRVSALEALNHAGFIEIVASKPLALARARREEKSREENARVPAREGSVDNYKSKGRRKAAATGWREVRGSHGLDYVPDPNGNARPPYPVPDLREMP